MKYYNKNRQGLVQFDNFPNGQVKKLVENYKKLGGMLYEKMV